MLLGAAMKDYKLRSLFVGAMTGIASVSILRLAIGNDETMAWGLLGMAATSILLMVFWRPQE